MSRIQRSSAPRRNGGVRMYSSLPMMKPRPTTPSEALRDATPLKRAWITPSVASHASFQPLTPSPTIYAQVYGRMFQSMIIAEGLLQLIDTVKVGFPEMLQPRFSSHRTIPYLSTTGHAHSNCPSFIGNLLGLAEQKCACAAFQLVRKAPE